MHAVLVRCRINRLRYIDRVTGERIRRYEHPYPGSLIHVDVTKFGNIPDGGGHRFLGRQAGERNSRLTANRTGKRTSSGHPLYSRLIWKHLCTEAVAIVRGMNSTL